MKQVPYDAPHRALPKDSKSDARKTRLMKDEVAVQRRMERWQMRQGVSPK
jgi:hypothetical protein